MKSNKIGKTTILSVLFFLVVLVISCLQYICPARVEKILYVQTSSFKLVYDHLFLVCVSSFFSDSAGLAAGILFTRKKCKAFLPAINALSSIAQTFPPIAVLALSVPILGFGTKPALTALVLYNFFPVLRSTVAGIKSVPPDIIEAAKGMGMKDSQILIKVELPLSAGIILGGVRISAIIGTGVAALGATIGAGGLGVPILSGLMNENYFHVLHGSILAAFLAVLLDLYLEKTEHFFRSRIF